MIQLKDNRVFTKTVTAFRDQKLHPSQWQHSLREDYRLNAWQLLSRDRSQHFAGAWHGVDRRRTLALLNSLIVEADNLQFKCDNENFVFDNPPNDPRAKLKVLRLLLTGGLQNPERQHRHKNKTGSIICLCKNGEPSLKHISWHCSRFAELRQPALDHLPVPLDQLPTCFEACALVPHSMEISTKQVRVIQQSLVSIWQSHINDWHNNPDNFEIAHPIVPSPSTSQDVTVQPSNPDAQPVDTEPLARNGHILSLSSDGGVFCRKCGKATKLIKHQRLKILSKPCQFPDLPQSQWLTSPGAMNNLVRFDKLWHELHQNLNQAGHKYFWNQKFGKDRKKDSHFGKLWCENCGKEYAWSLRYNNPATKCMPSVVPPNPPQWVLDCRLDPQMLIFFSQKPTNPLRLHLPHVFGLWGSNQFEIPTKVVKLHRAHPCHGQVWVEHCTAMREQAVCLVALTSTYYFWDPAGAHWFWDPSGLRLLRPILVLAYRRWEGSLARRDSASTAPVAILVL